MSYQINSYHIDFGAKAATFMDAIRWKTMERVFHAVPGGGTS